MGKAKGKQRRQPTSQPNGPAQNNSGPLAELLLAQGFTLSSDASAEPIKEPNKERTASLDVVVRAQRWIVRISKKGRDGRVANLLSPRGLSEQDDLSSLALRIRKQIGCGASLEGTDIVVQGDQRQRLELWLLKQGARTVTQG